MAKLTHNQRVVLRRLAASVPDATPAGLADAMMFVDRPVCIASARTAVLSLVNKGLAECARAASPMTYRITPAGRAALTEGQKP